MEKVTLQTQDGKTIAGAYFRNEGMKSYAGILLHMMPATKESWKDFIPRLTRAGYAALAIDFRGHGESEGGPAGHQNFVEEQHQQKIFDVRAASDFLKDQGFSLENQFVIGASIGANLALQFASENWLAHMKIVLLSPGLVYHGIEARKYLSGIDGRDVFLAASADDGYSYNTGLRLHEMIKGSKFLGYQGAGHGTNMFGQELPYLEDEVLKWLQEVLK